uniref:Pentraxin (PTX) domain-containing protein n=1 Tax=Neogobius melanostomus TaxID=47308 RepID=A0A8C6SCI6_9GOBI
MEKNNSYPQAASFYLKTNAGTHTTYNAFIFYKIIYVLYNVKRALPLGFLCCKHNGILQFQIFTDLKRDHSLFSLSSPSHHNEFLVFMSWASSLDYAPNKWHSICTTWNSSSGLVQMWFNGQPNRTLHGGGFAINQCFVGMMCDVHMWNYESPPCEILKYMKGEGVTPGNVLNWAALNYQSIGNVWIKDKQSCILS